MSEFDVHRYGAEIAALLPDREPNSLGPGTPNPEFKTRIQTATIELLFQHTAVIDREMAKACLAAVWLYHDFLEESHTLSQSIHTSTGSYWHGIMHRREPDYGNSSYWFHKTGSHPVFSTLCAEASKITQEHGVSSDTEFLAKQADWDPFAFIRLCESSYRQNDETETLCKKIQYREWQILFDYGYQKAVK